MTRPAFDDGATRPHVTESRRKHAAEVMADLDGATAASLDALPPELPVEALVACGNCLLYAGVPSLLAFPVWLAVAGARRLVSLLGEAAREADHLPDALAGGLPEEAEDAAAGLVQARMDSWAAMLQLDDVAERESGGPGSAPLGAAIDDFDAALERFDRALFARQAELGGLTGTNLFANLRSLLAPAHRDPLPWWLDGRIEDAAIDALVDETIFEPKAAAPALLPLRPTIAALRAALQHTFAAAASIATAGAIVPTAAGLSWSSAVDALVATLVAPATKQPRPERVTIMFRDAEGRPALSLVGKPCRLAGVEAVIERRSIDGADVVTATFPGDAFFGAGAGRKDEEPLELVVGDQEVAWAAGQP